MNERVPSLIYFNPQPEFPVEDISEENAAMAMHYLESAPEPEVYADKNFENLRFLHKIGNSALIGAGIPVEYTESEYRAFCHGFSTMDYLTVLVGSRQYKKIHTDGFAVNNFFMQYGDIVELKLQERSEAWIDNHPNTLEIMRTVAGYRNENLREYASRAMGAQIAGELLYNG